MRRGLVLALAFAAIAPAHAGMPVTQEMTCPVGGEKFSFTTTGSYSTWGGRPDGKPYGSWRFPLDLPECPGNGLVVYKEFASADLPRLRALVDSADYKALRKERPYYRAAWLMRGMGESAADVAWNINVASWQADGEPALKRRYQEEFVRAVDALGSDAGGSKVERFAMEIRAANAERELGRFDAAAARIGRVPRPALPAAAAPAKAGSAAGWRAREDLERRRGWNGFADALAVVIKRRDPSSEPLDMLDGRTRRARCQALPNQGNDEPLCRGDATAGEAR